jgi:hypothetical protein
VPAILSRYIMCRPVLINWACANRKTKSGVSTSQSMLIRLSHVRPFGFLTPSSAASIVLCLSLLLLLLLCLILSHPLHQGCQLTTHGPHPTRQLVLHTRRDFLFISQNIKQKMLHKTRKVLQMLLTKYFL